MTLTASPVLGTATGVERRPRFAVAIDAAASATVGIITLAWTSALDERFGMDRAALAWVAAVMVAWAALLAVLLRKPVQTRALRAISRLNAARILASVGVLIAGWSGRTSLGNGFVIAQALAVLLITAVQLRALRYASRISP